MAAADNKDDGIVQLAHGGGGRLMQQLIRDIFATAFERVGLDTRHDAAVLELPNSRIACTTDSFVVDPLFFPGGDIGRLAVYGTVNDLAMRGARPYSLTAGFILEEGLPLRDLRRIAESMAEACRRCGISLVSGDTKVVERGHGHGVYINTSGIGVLEHDRQIGPDAIAAGDSLIVNGDLGRHGLAIMACREELALETTIESDCAPLHDSVLDLIDAGIEVHCLRDLTRGGLVSALVELSEAAGGEIALEQAVLPIVPQVAAACELLGFDPLAVANEGRFVAIVPPEQKLETLEIIRASSEAFHPVVIGTVRSLNRPLVTIRSPHGTERVIDMLTGDQLPRIC